jgi:hypothetical protein
MKVAGSNSLHSSSAGDTRNNSLALRKTCKWVYFDINPVSGLYPFLRIVDAQGRNSAADQRLRLFNGPRISFLYVIAPLLQLCAFQYSQLLLRIRINSINHKNHAHYG